MDARSFTNQFGHTLTPLKARRQLVADAQGLLYPAFVIELAVIKDGKASHAIMTFDAMMLPSGQTANGAMDLALICDDLIKREIKLCHLIAADNPRFAPPLAEEDI